MPYEFPEFIDDHKSQLISSDIPEYFWYYLYVKLNDETYDIGDVCDLSLSDDKSQVLTVATKPLKASDGSNVFLIDNAWTFEMSKAKAQLKESEPLRERVAGMLSLDMVGASVEDAVEAIWGEIWASLRYYDITLKIPEERRKMWYVLDEVGSYIGHEGECPSVKIAPFIFTRTAVCYSVVWLIRDVAQGETLSVNRVEHISDPYLRNCISYIWTRQSPSQPSDTKTLSNEFFTSHRVQESNPDLSVANLGQLDHSKSPLLVYTDVAFVRNTVTDPRYKLTDNRESADILWLFDHFKEFEQLSRDKPRCLINQFPLESVMTIKDLLAALGSGSDWIVQTFNLKTELMEFINFCHENGSDNQDQSESECDCPCNCHNLGGVACGLCAVEESGDASSCVHPIKAPGMQLQRPVWIVKPWNLARGMGIFISDNVDHILRMVEAYPNEPKIACKYITEPVLFYRSELKANVKFDIRYMVLLSSVEPLKVYTTRVFWLRFANKEFVLGNWDDYETHFTVMNYRGECQLKNIMCEEFVGMFDSQYPKYPWVGVEKSIHKMLRQMMEDVTKRPDPMRIQHSPQSRGMYAVDLMLEWNKDDQDVSIVPRVCEVNYCPDCTRACQYHPSFFNDVFNTLFFGESNNVVELL